MWVLGTEPRSSTRAVNSRDISSGLPMAPTQSFHLWDLGSSLQPTVEQKLPFHSVTHCPNSALTPDPTLINSYLGCWGMFRVLHLSFLCQTIFFYHLHPLSSFVNALWKLLCHLKPCIPIPKLEFHCPSIPYRGEKTLLIPRYLCVTVSVCGCCWEILNALILPVEYCYSLQTVRTWNWGPVLSVFTVSICKLTVVQE